MNMKEIEALFVDEIGWIYADNEKIDCFTVNGEMALVFWYRKGNCEFNGKYVVMVRYKK